MNEKRTRTLLGRIRRWFHSLTYLAAKQDAERASKEFQEALSELGNSRTPK